MNFSRLFIIRPIATVLLMVAILLVGLVAYLQLPISALPEVNYPTIQVQTFYPGASPEVMASTVTEPLEKQFGQIPGLSQMTSTSSGGASVVVLQFSLSEKIDVAEQEVQAAINSASNYLPSDLPIPPTYSKTNPADAPVLTLALTSKSIALPQIQDLADTRLAPKISQLSGVGLVTVEGGQKPAVRIEANPSALSSYGLTLEDLRTAISGTSVNGAKGSLSGAQQAYTIDANDQLTSANQYKSIVVAYRNGSAVMLSDVAQVTNGVEDSQRAAYMNETPAIIVDIRRQSTANTIKVVDSIKNVLPQLQATLPAAIQVKILSDRTTTIRASVEDVEFELSLTIGLVVMVIFLFLRSWRATIIPSVSVPLSLIGTFAVMYKLGYSLNNLSLMALTIATGFVVDDAIVMLENISRYLEEGMAPLDAALKGSKEIGFTIISLTVSLVAVLIPLLFMSDITGRLFREFAVTLAVTIIVSAFVSLTLTPMMCSRLLKHIPAEKQGRVYHWSEGVFERVIAFYERTLTWVLERQFATLMVALTTIVGAVLLYYYIPKGFFPIQDTGLIQIITQAPEATSFDAMKSRQAQLARIVLQDPAVDSLSSMVGIDGTNTTVNSGRMQVTLKPLSERRINALEVIRRLKPKLKNIPGIEAYLQPTQDLTVEDRISRTQFQYTVEDPNAQELKEWTDKLVAKFKTLPEVEDVATDEQPDGNALTLNIDRDTASRLGISPQTLDDTLYDAFGQRQVTTLYTQTNQYHVILETLPQFRNNPERLQDIYIQGSGNSTSSTNSPGGSGGTSLLNASSTSGISAVSSNSSTLSSGSTSNQLASSSTQGSLESSSSGTVLQNLSSDRTSQPETDSNVSSQGGGTSASSSSSSSAPIPLAAFVTIKKTLKPLTISHQAQFPVVTISFNLASNAHLSQAVDAIDKAEASLHLPVNVVTGFQGTAASFKNSLTNEGLLVLAALLTVYIVLGVLYESYIHPLTILSTLPSAGVGALLALMLFGQDLGIVGIIGIVLLIGIVKKNGIMMVDFALQAQREDGKSPREAIFSACLLRFRPIMMTTLAALFAGIPLAFGSGIGAELRRPLGIAMVGGLLLSQVLTLYTTPVIYLWFDRLGSRFARQPKTHLSGPLGGEA